MAGLFDSPVGHAIIRADFKETWFPSQAVKGQPTDLGYFQSDFSLRFPIWQDGPDELSGSVHVRGEFFDTDAILPNTLQPFPQELWNIHVGTTYRHQFENGWIGGGTLSVGSASDKPFHGIDEMTAGVNAFLRIPQGEHNAWLFTLAYSSNSELPFPVPGVAYVWQPTDYFRANIGVPFQIMYRPMEDLTLDLSYMLLRTVHARATYRVTRDFRVYAGFDWSNESYLLVDRPSENDRLYYYEKRLTAGVAANLGRHFTVDVSGGYAFDRFYFEGASYSDNHFNRVDVGDGPFAAVKCTLKW
jgi:hypothetical protein